MIWIFVSIAVGIIISTAWFAVSLVTSRLNNTPSWSVFDIEEATEYISERLPARVSNQLSHDDVRLFLRWQLTYFRERGIASFGEVDRAAERAARANQVVIADEDELVDELLVRAVEDGLEVDAVDVVCVADLTAEYLVSIGAVGVTVDLSGALEPAPLEELSEKLSEADEEIR